MSRVLTNKRVVSIVIIIVGIFIWIVANSNAKQGITSPGFYQNQVEETPQPTPVPPVAPKTFEYDASSDLKAELEKINPEVLDSDFE